MLSLLRDADGRGDWGTPHGVLQRRSILLSEVFLFFLLFFFNDAWNINSTSKFTEQALKLSRLTWRTSC